MYAAIVRAGLVSGRAAAAPGPPRAAAPSTAAPGTLPQRRACDPRATSSAPCRRRPKNCAAAPDGGDCATCAASRRTSRWSSTHRRALVNHVHAHAWPAPPVGAARRRRRGRRGADRRARRREVELLSDPLCAVRLRGEGRGARRPGRRGRRSQAPAPTPREAGGAARLRPPRRLPQLAGRLGAAAPSASSTAQVSHDFDRAAAPGTAGAAPVSVPVSARGGRRRANPRIPGPGPRIARALRRYFSMSIRADREIISSVQTESGSAGSARACKPARKLLDLLILVWHAAVRPVTRSFGTTPCQMWNGCWLSYDEPEIMVKETPAHQAQT